MPLRCPAHDDLPIAAVELSIFAAQTGDLGRGGMARMRLPGLGLRLPAASLIAVDRLGMAADD
jgi:hypothetical protein